jgi:hypothetical protein
MVRPVAMITRMPSLRGLGRVRGAKRPPRLLDPVPPVFSLPVAISRHLLFRIDGASTVMPKRQKIVLHEAARFETARLVVIALCC